MLIGFDLNLMTKCFNPFSFLFASNLFSFLIFIIVAIFRFLVKKQVILYNSKKIIYKGTDSLYKSMWPKAWRRQYTVFKQSWKRHLMCNLIKFALSTLYNRFYMFVVQQYNMEYLLSLLLPANQQVNKYWIPKSQNIASRYVL